MRGACRRAFRSVVGLLAVVGFVLTAIPAVAGPDESTDLAAPYLHIPVAIPGATGPFSTVFYVSSTTAVANTIVNVKCFNDQFQRVGPAAGTNVMLTAFDVNAVTPVSLGLTLDPLFNGLGWCYFARIVGDDDVAVAFAWGIQGTNPGTPPALHPLFGSNASRAISTGTAQAAVSDQDANVPFWVGGPSWQTFIVLVNPTPTSYGPLFVDVFGTSGELLGTTSGDTLSSRDLDVYNLAGFGGTQGNADVRSGIPECANFGSNCSRGFMGWVFGLNFVSLEAFTYNLPLDKDDVFFAGLLDPTDRP